MFRIRCLSLLTAFLCCIGLVGAAAAAEVDCDSVYCFSAGDFSGEVSIAGICITDLPGSDVGTFLLGSPKPPLPGDQLVGVSGAPARQGLQDPVLADGVG